MLFKETHTCIVWAGNSLVGESLTLDAYMVLGHVYCQFGNANTSFEEWLMKDRGYNRRIEVSTSNFTSLPHFVIGTNRIATMHSRPARIMAWYYPIRVVPPPLAIPQLEKCMQWSRCLDKDHAHLWLRALLVEIASAEPGSGTAGYAK